MDFKKLECAYCFKVGASKFWPLVCKHVYVCTCIYCMLIVHIALAFLSLGVLFLCMGYENEIYMCEFYNSQM